MIKKKRDRGFAYIDGEIQTVNIEMEKDGQSAVTYYKIIHRDDDEIWPTSKEVCYVLDTKDVYDTMDDCKKSRLVANMDDMIQHSKWATREINYLEKELERIKNHWWFKLFGKF